ncbi:helix-turn-helix domain-containing protein [Streptomyces heilongjiangensis]|uniref:Helix-turn-helix domain-containing protein n=1 Tax=Streptomyces heilongjiangensis TaxID=945052 RepID=A0ABW1B427_9ACTN|nr:helix-turn-helix domain-containing protein [Streptomyces heilongjiangensis]MDC2945791.1 helix-turn-helix domain-containing protein [Streptomyces heilongjiangensis]
MSGTKYEAVTAVLALLDLLAGEGSANRFEAVVEEARRQGVTGGDLRMVERIKRLALGIQARLERRQQRSASLATLVDTASDLASPHTVEDTLKIITRRARLLLGVDVSWVTLPTADDDGALRLHSLDGHVTMLNTRLRLPEGAGLAAAVLAHRAPLWTSDYLTDDSFRHSAELDQWIGAEGLHAVLAVPLSRGTAFAGSLHVADRSVRHFSADEIALANMLAEIGGVALSRAVYLDETLAAMSALRDQLSHAEADLADARGLAKVQGALLSRVLDGCDPQLLVEECHFRLGAPVLLCGPDGTTIAAAGDLSERGEEFARATKATGVLLDPAPALLQDGIWSVPVLAGSHHLGALYVQAGPALTGDTAELLRYVARVVAVLLSLQERRGAAVEEQLRDELLEDLLISGPRPRDLLERRARRLGIGLDQPHVVVIARLEGGAQAHAVTRASTCARRLNGLQTTHKGDIVLLLPGTDPGTAARTVHDELSSLPGSPPTVSGSGPVSDPGAVLHGYRDAARCLDAMTALGATGTSASTHQLGFLGLLLSDQVDAERFIQGTIGAVLDYDEQRLTELMRTLDAYFDNGGSPTYAAEQLHVHPNTVARRLERIGELIGSDWQKPERALEIQLALRMSRIRRVLRERDEPGGDRAGDQDA